MKTVQENTYISNMAISEFLNIAYKKMYIKVEKIKQLTELLVKKETIYKIKKNNDFLEKYHKLNGYTDNGFFPYFSQEEITSDDNYNIYNKSTIFNIRHRFSNEVLKTLIILTDALDTKNPAFKEMENIYNIMSIWFGECILKNDIQKCNELLKMLDKILERI